MWAWTMQVQVRDDDKWRTVHEERETDTGRHQMPQDAADWYARDVWAQLAVLTEDDRGPLPMAWIVASRALAAKVDNREWRVAVWAGADAETTGEPAATATRY